MFCCSKYNTVQHNVKKNPGLTYCKHKNQKIGMYTIIQYIILVPLVSPHPYILHIVPSGMLHPATGSWIVWTLSAGRAGLKNIFTKYDQHHKYRKIYQYITEIIFPGTHLESLRRAKLEPSGPHITWAIVTSCLLDQSGAPSRMSDTPSHTRYSLRFGTLNRHKKKLIQLEILHSYHSLGPLTFYHPTPKTKKGDNITMRRSTLCQ